MTTTSVNIPSRNIPFTDSQGVLSPIWYEFLRSFIAGAVGGTIINPGVAPQVLANNGLVGGGPITSNVPLRVGQGVGIAVNADDVNIDITDLAHVLGTLDDEIIISRPTDNNAIRKTTLREVAGLSSPGGLDSHVQYNSSGSFAGNSGFTYDGVGSITVGAITINGAAISTATNSDKMVFRVPGGTSTTHFTFRQVNASGSSDMPVLFTSNLGSTELVIDNCLDGSSSLTESRLKFNQKGTTKWIMGCDGSSSGSNFVMALSALNVGFIYKIDGTTNNMAMSQSFFRSITPNITAATTQTQGQRALTTDINEISVCANANDVVTLPVALAGRYCLVINDGVQTLQIFPASGDNLGAGANTSTTIPSGTRILFNAYDSTNWVTVAAPPYTDENAQDAVGAMTGTSLVYSDSGATLQRAALTGDVTASQDSNATLITTPGVVTVATDDKVLIKDTSASNVLKYVTAQSIADLASAGGVADGDKGDITVSSSGTVWTIDNSVITLAKQADMATSSLVYRKTSGAGAPEINTLATVKTDLGLTGTNSGDQTITLTGDVTGSGTGSFAATIANDAVTYAKIQNVSATDKLLGRSSSGAGDIEEIALTSAGRALIDDADNAAQRTTLGLGTLATQSGTFSGTSSGTNTGDQTITLTGDVTGSGTGSFATTIANSAVTLAKQANMATSSLVYRKTAGAGAPEINTLATVKTDLGLTGTNSGDQTSMTGISDTKTNFNTACSDGDFLFVGDITQGLLHPQVMARLSVGF